MLVTRRELLSSAVPAAALATKPALAGGSFITPEHFGARGDGITNDSTAFSRLVTYVNARGGGEILLRPVTYIVGQQVRGGDVNYLFEGPAVLEFARCSAPLIIRGNGAVLRCAAGLRYGTFEVSGRPKRHPMPYLGGGLATPYRAMIAVSDCHDLVEISDIELDGNLPNLIIGGQYGDVGWQIPASGIHLLNNEGAEHLIRVHCHHHALDGVLIDGTDLTRASRSRFLQVRSDHNGRQGCSVVGGQGYDFLDCRFTDTGKSAIESAPGAGVDIEAEAGKRVRDLTFTRCTFSNNKGSGMVADGGQSEAIRFDACTFIGTSNWAAWPNKPGMRFTRCTFVGPIVHAYGDANPARACQFHGCTFLDDPALSPTGKVYGGENPSRPIADLPDNRNVLFDRCNFKLTDRAVLPWTTNLVIFANCTMSQRSPATAYPRGTFIGRNTIHGKVALYSAKVKGDLILNGNRVPPTS